MSTRHLLSLAIAIIAPLAAIAADAAADGLHRFKGRFPDPFGYSPGRAEFTYYTVAAADSSTTPVIDGPFTYRHADNEVTLSGTYVDGVQQGKWRFRNPDFDFTINFADGRPEGQLKGVCYDYDGRKVDFNYSFRGGLLNGPFNVTGKKFYVAGYYDEGRPAGVWTVDLSVCNDDLPAGSYASLDVGSSLLGDNVINYVDPVTGRSSQAIFLPLSYEMIMRTPLADIVDRCVLSYPF